MIAEYGGKWKMLHYFAKNFFCAKILSAYIERDIVSVYYVNDDIHWQKRQGHASHSLSLLDSETDMKQSITSTQKWMKHRHETPVTDDDNRSNVDDMIVNLKQELRHSQSADNFSSPGNCTIMVQCFSWNSFEPRAKWDVTFPQVCLLIFYYNALSVKFCFLLNFTFMCA